MSFSSYNKKYNALTLREKVLVQISSIITITAILLLTLLEPSYLGMEQAKKQYANQLNIADLNKQKSKELRESLASPPETALEERITALQFQYDDLKEELYTQQLAIISGASFSTFLKRIFLSAKQVNIDDFQINATAYAGDDENSDTEGSLILKQSISLTVRSTEQNIQDYLTFLENQSVVIVWDSLIYNQLSIDESNVIIEFHLYSAKE